MFHLSIMEQMCVVGFSLCCTKEFHWPCRFKAWTALLLKLWVLVSLKLHLPNCSILWRHQWANSHLHSFFPLWVKGHNWLSKCLYNTFCIYRPWTNQLFCSSCYLLLYVISALLIKAKTLTDNWFFSLDNEEVIENCKLVGFYTVGRICY